MLMGFADLVFEHDGRYWVLDYKSNQLGPDGRAYSPEALDAAMLHHRYDVQAALYLLALHRLLRARLGEAYRPEAQLGGALYLFLRGIDGPTRGTVHLPPPWPCWTPWMPGWAGPRPRRPRHAEQRPDAIAFRWR
jgi:exodeoxyribonuclease V beta subunit